MTITIATPPTSTLQILLEALSDGTFMAWAVALPDCRVVADSREGAIEALERRLEERMVSIDVLEIEIPITPAKQPLWKFSGILKDDPMFAEWHDRFWAEKQRIDDDEEILTIEEMLKMS